MPNLLDDIEAFIAAQELSESQFGTSAINDKNLVVDLRNGRDIRLSTAAKVRAFMASYRPEADAA